MPNAALTIAGGAVLPWAKSNPPSPYYQQVLASVGRAYGFTLKSKWSDLTDVAKHVVLSGTGGKPIALRFEDGRKSYEVNKAFEGVIANLDKRFASDRVRLDARRAVSRYQSSADCEVCHGARLRPEALSVKIDGETIADAVRRPGQPGLSVGTEPDRQA